MMVWRSEVSLMSIFMLSWFLWSVVFLGNVNEFITATSAATFYFGNEKESRRQLNQASVEKASEITYANHLGSIAFRSGFLFMASAIKIIILPILKLASLCLSEEASYHKACLNLLQK